MRHFFSAFSLLFIAGCAAASRTTFTDASGGNPAALHATVEDHALTLDGSEVQAERISRFLKSKPAFSELDKIYYLLSAIRDSKATFVRNGDQFKGDKASSWLRWKMRHRQYQSNPIVTARDFVDRVCLQSNKTGVAYEVILLDGRRKPLREIMSDELVQLEAAIREAAMTNAARDPDSSKPLGARQKGTSLSVLIPAGAK